MSEVDAARAIGWFRLARSRWQRAVPATGCAHQDSLHRRILNRPGLAPIQAASQQMFFRFLAVDGVAVWAQILVITGAKTNQELVTPPPNALVCWKTRESATFVIDEDMSRRCLLLARCLRCRFVRNRLRDFLRSKVLLTAGEPGDQRAQ